MNSLPASPAADSRWCATAAEVLADLLRDLAARGCAAPAHVGSYPRDPAGDRAAASQVTLAKRGHKKHTSRDNDAIFGTLPSLGWTRTREGAEGRGGEYAHLLGYRLRASVNSYAEYCGVELDVILPLDAE